MEAKQRVPVRMSDAEYQWLKAKAESESRSMSAQLVAMIREKMKEDGK